MLGNIVPKQLVSEIPLAGAKNVPKREKEDKSNV